LQAKRLKRLLDRQAARAVEAVPSTDVAPESHGYGVEHSDREAVVDVDLLREIGNVAGLEPIEAERTGKWLELTDDALEQGRLAGAVRTHQSEQVAANNLSRDMVHRRVPVVAERQIVKADGWKFRLTHGRAHSQTSAHRRTVIVPTTASRAGTERRSNEKPNRDGATANSAACS
jgi:hypothetical protein